MKQSSEKIRLAAIGYGNRVRKYLKFVADNEDDVELCAVVDIDDRLLSAAKTKFNLPEDALFRRVEDFFCSDIKVDGVIIGTPDDTHYEIAMMAISHGCHILLEKPIAQTYSQCCEIYQAAKEKGVEVVVCYVLRYHPFYVKMKEIIDSKMIGDLVSINHIVNVGLDRTTHSYVRGLWSNSGMSNPMILSKCCHDIDLMVWFTDSKARDVSSYGSLRWFREENAPSGSAHRCVKCRVEQSCPFSSVDLYVRRKEWVSNFVVPEGSTLDDVLSEELATGDYGRCVYHCDNDVVDNQVVSMLMDNGAIVSLTMDCFTLEDDRLTDIKCVFGEIVADATKIRVRDFRRRVEEVYDFSNVNNMPFHANADLEIVRDFVNCIRNGVSWQTPTVEASVESHRICFLAEDKRLAALNG